MVFGSGIFGSCCFSTLCRLNDEYVIIISLVNGIMIIECEMMNLIIILIKNFKINGYWFFIGNIMINENCCNVWSYVNMVIFKLLYYDREWYVDTGVLWFVIFNCYGLSYFVIFDFYGLSYFVICERMFYFLFFVVFCKWLEIMVNHQHLLRLVRIGLPFGRLRG